MLRASGWRLEERAGSAPHVHPPGAPADALAIVRRFEFDHGRMLMSVVVRDGAGGLRVYTKGAPETISAVCDARGFEAEEQLAAAAAHAGGGCYVLALATKPLEGMSDAALVRAGPAPFTPTPLAPPFPPPSPSPPPPASRLPSPSSLLSPAPSPLAAPSHPPPPHPHPTLRTSDQPRAHRSQLPPHTTDPPAAARRQLTITRDDVEAVT